MRADLQFIVPGDLLFRISPYGEGWQFMCMTDDCDSRSHYVDYETTAAAQSEALKHLRQRHGLIPKRVEER